MARRTIRARNKVERRIYFFRVDAGLDDNGRPLPFDPAPVLRHIDALPWTVRGRYWIGTDGRVTGCWIDDNQEPYKLRLGNIRRTDLPQLEQAGQLQPLVIPEESGLAESIHVVFFPDNIVGADFNFYGPRLSRLALYFAEKAQRLCPPVFFEPLLRRDVVEQIDRLGDIRLFRLKIQRPYIATIAQADRSLARAFEAAAQAGDAEELEIILRPARYSRGWLHAGLLDTVRRLARADDLRDSARTFKIKGFDRDTERVEEIDILNDKLIAKKTILRLNDRTRALDPDSAYEAIEEAYGELKDQLLEAAGVRQ